MAELNGSELPVVRETQDMYSKSFFNFSNNRPQKFIVITILAYFGTKIFNNFFNVVTQKSTTQETLDMLSTLVLSGVLFYLTGMNNRSIMGDETNPNFAFFIGLILGTTESLFEDKVLNKLRNNSLHAYISLKLILLIICCGVVLFNLFISRTVSAQNYPSTGNYLIYLFIIGAILTALYFSKMTNVMCNGPTCPPDIPINPDNPVDPTCPTTPSKETSKTTPTVLSLKTTQFNISFGLVAWLMALTFLYDSSNKMYQTVISALFGFFIGTYISNFSTYGVQYTVQSNTVLSESTELKPSQINAELNQLDITTKDKYDIFNTVDGKKYKKEMDVACKIVINKDLVINSKKAKTPLFYNCIENKMVLDGANKITFFVDKISYIKIVMFLIVGLGGVIVLIYIINQIVPMINL